MLENVVFVQKLKSKLPVDKRPLLALILMIILIVAMLVLLAYLTPSSEKTKTPKYPGSLIVNPTTTPTSNPTTIPTPRIKPTPPPTPTPKPTPKPTPTPTLFPLAPLLQGPQTYSISSKGIPQLSEASFNTIDPKGDTQTVKLKIRDEVGTVTSVTALVKTETLSKAYNLTYSSGTGTETEWTGSWKLNDKYDYRFMITFSATDDKGNKSSIDLTIR